MTFPLAVSYFRSNTEFTQHPSHGETTIWRQPWYNGALVGSPVPALKLPFALREDYSGNAYSVAPDFSSVVFARPGGYDDLYLLSQK